MRRLKATDRRQPEAILTASRTPAPSVHLHQDLDTVARRLRSKVLEVDEGTKASHRERLPQDERALRDLFLPQARATVWHWRR